MKRRFLLLATLLCSHLSAASESKLIEDAPKGFIHVTEERLQAEIHHYLRTDSILRVEQFSEENDGKMRHYIRLIIPADSKVQLEFDQKEDSDKVLKRILELLSQKD